MDDLYNQALEIAKCQGKASAPLFQRKLRISYYEANHLLELLQKGMVIGPSRGSKPREILIQTDN